MNTIERSIDVEVPVRTAYNQWTQFETFPRFMDGVTEVEQLDDRMLHWSVEIGGVERSFDAEITEQIPDKRIAWSAVDGPRQGGVVTFHELSDDTTRIMYQMDFDPSGVVERVGVMAGVVERRIDDDLERFKKYIEARPAETGGWRGEIDG